MKSYKKTILITTLITLLPILIGLVLWNRLPDSIATHWDSDGTPNGWSGKPFAVFAMPCIMAAIHLFAVCITLNDPKRKNIHKKPLIIVFWLVPVLSIVTNGIIYLTALSIKVNVTAILSILIGIMFILLGNYMPKLQQNYTVGIKLPWTLNSTENWTRTHRLGGKTFIAGGLVIILCSLLDGLAGGSFSLIAIIAVLVLCTAIPMGYSFWLFRKGV